MPAPYSADLRWRVIWFVHILQDSVAVASFFLSVCERTVERYVSKFLVNRHVKPGPVGRSYGSISLALREELIGRDPFNQSSNRSDREKRTTSKGGPVFSKLFRLDRTDPLSFGPKFPEILVEWIAPIIFAYQIWEPQFLSVVQFRSTILSENVF